MAHQKQLPYPQRLNTSLWKKARMQALVRDNFTCQLNGCGETRFHLLTVHHLLPREEGGTHDLANLLTVCETCHEKIHAKTGGVALLRKLKGHTAKNVSPATIQKHQELRSL